MVDVKLFLRLTKSNTTKTYPVFNYAPHHEEVWWSGSIAPRILNLSTRRRRVGSFTPRLLCP